jgi:CRISPR-associated protein Csy1
MAWDMTLHRDMRTDSDLLRVVNDAVRANDLDRAIVGLSELVRRHPANPALTQRLATAYNNRGARLARVGSLNAAASDFRAALMLDPLNADAEVNQARLFATAKRWDDALQALARVSARFPEDAELRLDFAETKLLAGTVGAKDELDRAITAAEASGQVDPARLAQALAAGGHVQRAVDVLASATPDAASPALSARVADRLCEVGEWKAARSVYAVAARAGGHGQTSPSLRAAIGERLALPFFYRDHAELADARTRFVCGLDDLVATYTSARLAQCERSLIQLTWTQQMLAYQGEPDRDLLSRWGDWLDNALRVFAPQLAEPPARRDRLDRRSIAFVSAKLGVGVIESYFRAWIDGLAASGLSVTTYRVDPPTDQASAGIGAGTGRVVHLTGSIETLASTIRDAGHAALIYPDVGIDPRTTLLAALRLAPRQYAAWGHPETTGLPSIDAYISCTSMEPPDAASHYRERLLLLPGAGSRFIAPGDAIPVSRDALGFAPGDRIHLIPHVPPKLHPDCDRVFAAIAAADPHAVLVHFEYERREPSRAIHQRLSAALEQAGANPARQLRLLPKQPRARFLGICRIADTMLDTLHWSGGANSIDALASGLPVITCPGKLMRGRQTLGLLQAIGCGEELVAADPQGMVDLATAIGADRDRRTMLGIELSERSRALFGDASPVQVLSQLLHADLELA